MDLRDSRSYLQISCHLFSATRDEVGGQRAASLHAGRAKYSRGNGFGLSDSPAEAVLHVKCMFPRVPSTVNEKVPLSLCSHGYCWDSLIQPMRHGCQYGERRPPSCCDLVVDIDSPEVQRNLVL